MANAVIASKTDENSWVFGAESCSVTLTLVQLSNTDPKFGLSYSATWSGIKSGSTAGGPYPVAGNMSQVVNPSPQVTLTISNYTDTGSTISLQAEITVETGIPLVGTVTVFNDTLSGAYPAPGLPGMVESLQQAHANTQAS